MVFDGLSAAARKILGRDLKPHEISEIEAYVRLLRKWNSSRRMIGSDDESWILQNIILDSLIFLKAIPDHARSVADMGSGAGVPGIPIKIVRPEVDMVLIESRRWRASFLSAAVREIPLRNTRVVAARVEDVPELGGAFDCVVTRCAGPWCDVVPVGLRLLRRGGRLIVAGPPEPGSIPGVEWVRLRIGNRTRTLAILGAT